MSRSRTVLSRPRTKLYDCNYNIGQSYYKSALDGLDRKYGRLGSSEPPTNGALSGLRASSERERQELPSPRAIVRDVEDDEFFNELPRRKTNSAALLGEFDSIFETRVKNGVPKERTPQRSLRAVEDEIEEDIAASMKRLKARAAIRAAAEEIEEMESTSRKSSNLRSKLDFSDKLIESVGISGRARAALEEEASSGKRRALKMIKASEGISDNEQDLTKWTALKSGSGRRHVLEDEEEQSASQLAAAARARKSRARLDDLEAEMQALAERGAAREKRVRDLKALVQENEANSKETLHSAVRIKSTIQSEKKVVNL